MNRPGDTIGEGERMTGEGLLERLRELSFVLASGGAEETDPARLLDRIEWGVGHIQQVEATRTAGLIEELSKTPKTTWGEVKKAVLGRAFTAPVREHAAQFAVEMGHTVPGCSRSGAEETTRARTASSTREGL